MRKRIDPTLETQKLLSKISQLIQEDEFFFIKKGSKVLKIDGKTLIEWYPRKIGIKALIKEEGQENWTPLITLLALRDNNFELADFYLKEKIINNPITDPTIDPIEKLIELQKLQIKALTSIGYLVAIILLLLVFKGC